MRPAQGFAVHIQEFTVGDLMNCLHPANEAVLEFFWVQAGKQTVKGVMGRNAMGQGEKRF